METPELLRIARLAILNEGNPDEPRFHSRSFREVAGISQKQATYRLNKAMNEGLLRHSNASWLPGYYRSYLIIGDCRDGDNHPLHRS